MGDNVIIDSKTNNIDFNPHLLSLEMAADTHLDIGPANWTKT